jgi:alpha-1,2-mannosyltransferase
MTGGGFPSRASVLLAAAAAIVSYGLIWACFKPMLFSASKSDFSCFYRAGRMVIAGDRGRVYDLDAQRAYDQRLGTGFINAQGRQFSLPFVFPPYALALFAPLSCLPYPAAELAWYVANAAMLLALPFVLRGSLKSSDRAVAAELLAPVLFVPAVLALMQGQPSILLLLLSGMGFAALAQGKETAAGFALGLATLKPQLVLPMLLALMIWRRWRAIAAMFGTVVALLGLSVAIVGWRATLDYPAAVVLFNHLPASLGGEHPESMPNLRGSMYVLLREHLSETAVAGITIALSFLLLAILALLLKQSPAVSRSSYSLVVVVTCLLSYHAYLHDDSLLLLPVILLTQHLLDHHWTAAHTALAAATGGLYMVPLLPTSLTTTALQMATAMMFLVTVLAWRISGDVELGDECVAPSPS